MAIPILGAEELTDSPARWPITGRDVLAANPIVRLVRDQVRTPDGGSMTRDWLQHLGAVGVIAVDDDDCVILLRQYRHPAGFVLVEPPAGLLDVPGEDYLAAAQRELAEEAALAAAHWQLLVDIFTSPGGFGESARVFLASGLSAAPRPAGFMLADEEAHMELVRAPLGDVGAAILAGRLQSPLLVVGVMSLMTARATGQKLRPADAPWPARKQFAPW